MFTASLEDGLDIKMIEIKSESNRKKKAKD